jgi:pimeloyl-ACP methyl ester carboxylesterase
MKTFTSDGVELEYRVRGDGEPLLLIHGGMIADSFEPIAGALAASYELITYRRRGYHGTPPHPDCTMSKVAADAIALLDHLGIGTAHVGGHSYGGCTALQLALDAPERVHTLPLLEACVMGVPAAADFSAGAAAIVQMLESGEAESALVALLTAVGGPDPVSRLDMTLPEGWFEHARDDLAAVTFAADIPSLGAWPFGREQAVTITHPALTFVGSDSAAWYTESHDAFNQWFPNAEPFVLAGATHMLHWENPEGVAAGLLEFLARHPMR